MTKGFVKPVKDVGKYFSRFTHFSSTKYITVVWLPTKSCPSEVASPQGKTVTSTSHHKLNASQCLAPMVTPANGLPIYIQWV